MNPQFLLAGSWASVDFRDEIFRDAEGRYCLNDLHRAADGLSNHQPGKFFANLGT